MAEAARAARIENKIRRTLVASAKVFIITSRGFISLKMDTERGHRYFKEILHSIFFICYIYRQSIDPEEILGETLKPELAEMYPDVFESYTSQLPRRPPFSILLEVVVETSRNRSVTAILQELAQLNDDMIIHRSEGRSCANDFCFGATVVSCSYFQRSSQTTQNYFGASMSCKGPTTTMIFISLSCIETWNENVAHAVCLAAKQHRSITLPDTVYSTAYHVRRVKEGENYSHKYEVVPPCLWCQNTFPNVTFSPVATEQNKPEWQYGNCAECEAISNLLNGEISVSEETQQLNRSLVPRPMVFRADRKAYLIRHLIEYRFPPEARFYNP